MDIEEGRKVKLHYTLRVDGEIIDSSRGRDPLLYLHGTESLVPGLQKALVHHQAGEKIQVQVPPDEAYGPFDEDAISEVPKKELPEGQLKVGYRITAEGVDGNFMYAIIKEIRDQSVIVDFNHPLAGKMLDFDVEIIEVI